MKVVITNSKVVITSLKVVITSSKVVITSLKVVITNFKVVITNLKVVITSSKVVITSSKVVITNFKVVITSSKVVITSLKVVITSSKVVITNSKVVITSLKVVITNSKVVITSLKVVITSSKVVITNSKVVITSLKVVITSSKVVITSSKVVITSSKVVITSLKVVITSLKVVITILLLKFFFLLMAPIELRRIEYMPFIKNYSAKLQIFLGYNNIHKFPKTDITLTENVVLLDLSYNYIKTITRSIFSHYPSITDLNLAGNRLTTVPSVDEWKIINSLEVLELRGNNFTCNCSGSQLKETLVSLNARIKVKDLNQIKCSFPSAVKGKVIYNLSDSLFGCPFVNLVLILTMTLSLLLSFSVCMFIAYVFRYYINLFLFIHCGWRFCYSYTNEETTYDAFISYSSKDSDWVIDQLMNPLENLNPPYHLCLHERDFLIGVPICDNISKAIEGSKCTVCVVSKNWLESDWCQFEFRVAHCLATIEKQIRLLVIIKEEIPKDKIKGDLKYYMKTFTYLDSAQPLFLSRLLNDLPRPDVEEVRDENGQRDVIELL